MIVVDTSAIVAIAKQEPGFESLAARLEAAEHRKISPMSAVEAVMVLSNHFTDAPTIVDAYLREAKISLCTVDGEQAAQARFAFLAYGKGRHPAKLNLGDCFSYAAAKVLNAPLLYVGGDFAKTDIRAA
jgi:ribonuclease VapC